MLTLEELTTIVDTWLDKIETIDLTQSEFDELLEYSTMDPTDKTIGKQWKSQIYFGKYRLSWVRAESVPDEEDPENVIGIVYHKINVLS